MKRKILLIGGGGYVGNSISEHFLTSGYEVRVLDNFIYQHLTSTDDKRQNANFILFNGEMDDPKLLCEASEGVEAVILLGGLVGDPITKKYPNLSHRHNETAIKNCIDYFDDRPINRLVFISTCSNYGVIPEDTMADEEYQLSPLSLYAKAKVAAEQYVLEKRGKVPYHATILRFATAFGLSSRMRFDLTVSEFTKELFLGNELYVFDENTWRPYCHVKDFALLIEMVISAPNEKVSFEVFNAGGDRNNFTKKMIVDAILAQVPEGRVKFGREGSDPRNYRVSFEKVERTLGFQPSYTIEDGIAELIVSLRSGKFKDVQFNSNRYGNYEIPHGS